MFGNSLPVRSNQSAVHDGLARTVTRHLRCRWQAPVADHDRHAFGQANRWLAERAAGRPVWLDSGCGTGRAAVTLARRHPEVVVLGLDQSEKRLQRGISRFAPLPENVLLLRTDCSGFWRLAAAAGWRPARHCLLYPNPWPKSAHLKRRWHGHPVFPDLLALGGILQVRSNWPLYLQEMAAALTLAGLPAPAVLELAPDGEPLTDFEDKYGHSGHRLWQLQADLDALRSAV